VPHIELRQSEIEDFDLRAYGHKDIRRLKVPVDDAVRVSGIETIGSLDAQIQQLFTLERFSGYAVLERSAIQKFHDDERLSVVFVHLINSAYVRMTQGRRCACLALKPL
jgi:hypothetical protein